MLDFQNLSDKDLFGICKKWGAAVLEARRKFAGFLPEVQRREMAAREKGGSWVKKRGFTCIYEFAGRLAGMSRDQVDEVLRLDRRLEDKPVLREALVSGTVSVNKLARVVSIATVENQTELLVKVEALSKVGLDCFVKDYQRENSMTIGLDRPQDGRKMDGFQMPQNGQISLYGQNENADIWHAEAIEKTDFERGGNSEKTGTPHRAQMQAKKLPVNLDEDIAKELIEMQSKGIDVNGILREFLRERKEKLEREKAEVAEKQMRERDDRAVIGYPAKRYVPAVVLRVIRAEFGDKCATPGCSRAAENLHHENGFAKDSCHDPRYLKPLCRGHHELTHTG